MTLERGQGLNHSITDAGKLRDALASMSSDDDQAKAITRYEEEIGPRWRRSETIRPEYADAPPLEPRASEPPFPSWNDKGKGVVL
jgi:hypothetical protein